MIAGTPRRKDTGRLNFLQAHSPVIFLFLKRHFVGTAFHGKGL